MTEPDETDSPTNPRGRETSSPSNRNDSASRRSPIEQEWENGDADEHDAPPVRHECIIEAEGCQGPSDLNMVVTVLGHICFPCFGTLMAERIAPHLRVGVLKDG